MKLDINCDLGEGMNNDAQIMPFITSANIACGFHAGSAEIMKHTVSLCVQHKVKIGAHPSFLDRENFGRTEMEVSDKILVAWITEQVLSLKKICSEQGATLHHVKPHGALYNMSARNEKLARVIAQTIKKIDGHLIVYGLSGSVSISEAKKIGLKTANEIFADRTYQSNGSLTPRTKPNAMIEDADKAAQQVLKIMHEQKVIAVTGEEIYLVGDTVCIHGDGKHALSFAKKIHQMVYAS